MCHSFIENKGTKKVALLIDYDGTEYGGWQRQKNTIGIQEIIESALQEVTGKKTILRAAGRTDKGVHAKGQVADFFTDSTIPGEKFKYPLNNILPDDIRIMASREVDLDFSARFDAKMKHYRYTLYLGETCPATLGRYMSLYKHELDIEKLIKAGKVLEGEHDFKAFEGPYAQMSTSIRRVNKVDIERRENIVEFNIYGEAFLKNMVRIMVGTMLKVSEGKLSLAELEKLFVTRDKAKAGKTMPANGLTMMEIFYEKKLF